MRTYGNTDSSVLLNLSTGLPMPGVQVLVWDAETGGTQVTTGLLATDGTTPLPGYLVSGPDGSFGHKEAGTADARWYSTAAAPTRRWYAEAHEALSTRATPADIDAKIVAERAVTATTYAPGHDPKLRKWYGALANRYAAPTRVLVMGDSNSEGTAASSYARRWQAVLQAQLRARFQPPGVVGAAIPYVTASPRCNPLPTGLGVTTAGSPVQASFGLGLRALTIGPAQSVTFTFTGDRCKLLVSKGSAVGRYNIALDGGAGVVVDGFQSGGGVVSGVVLWDSGALTRGSHTVVVTRDAGTTASPGNVYPEGLLTYDGDLSSGVRVVDGARHGATLATFTGSTAWQNAVTNVGGFGLCIMPWGANDATSGTTPAAFRAGLESLIASLRTAGFAGSVLLVEMPKRGNATEQVWTDYRTQIEALAAADPDVSVLDLRRRMPDYGTAEATALGLYYDEAHYLDQGQGWIADQLATAITPR